MGIGWDDGGWGWAGALRWGLGIGFGFRWGLGWGRGAGAFTRCQLAMATFRSNWPATLRLLDMLLPHVAY